MMKFCYFKKIDDWVNRVSLMLLNHEWTLYDASVYDNLVKVVGNIYELFEL